MSRRWAKPTTGFTLTELLIVMGVVTILVAVLVPVIVQSRNRARAQQCMANLRQIGDAVALYGQDWADTLPRLSASPFAGSMPTLEWPRGTSATEARSLLQSRTGGGSVFRCRCDAGSPEFGFAVGEGTVFDGAGSSYVPWSTVRAGKFGVSINGARAAALRTASRLILFRDYGSEWHGRRLSRGGVVYSVEQANAVYADGHAAATPTTSITTAVGRYSCAIVGVARGAGTLFLCGVSEAGRVELTGTYDHGGVGAGELQLRLSGAITGTQGHYNVDRVFSYGSGVGVETVINQVIYWIESFMAR